MSEVISQILYDHDNDGENLSERTPPPGHNAPLLREKWEGGSAIFPVTQTRLDIYHARSLITQSHRHGWTYTCTNVFDDRCLAAGRGDRVVPTTPPPPALHNSDI